MAKLAIHPSNTPKTNARVTVPTGEQLADLASLLGLMQAAARISEQLDEIANRAGGSLEKIAASFQVPYDDVYNTYVAGLEAKPARHKVAPKQAATPRKLRKVKKA